MIKVSHLQMLTRTDIYQYLQVHIHKIDKHVLNSLNIACISCIFRQDGLWAHGPRLFKVGNIHE